LYKISNKVGGEETHILYDNAKEKNNSDKTSILVDLIELAGELRGIQKKNHSYVLSEHKCPKQKLALELLFKKQKEYS